MSSAGPIAIVSGGSSGIGMATVEALLELGYRVAFFSQSADRTSAAREELIQRFDENRVFAMAADLNKPEEVSAFFAEIGRCWGNATVLVCNAGFSPKRLNRRIPLVETSVAQWNEVLHTNLTGAMLCCRHVLPAMAEAGYGRIVLIGSIAGRTLPRVAGAAYATSKAAMVGLARALVSEYSGQGITTNTVCPGRIVSEMTGNPDSTENISAKSRIPCGRLGDPHDVARVVTFLASPDSSFINGAIIDVNGGEFTPS